jgi:hypothetical protein
MNRHPIILGLAATALFALSACGSDSKSSLPGTESTDGDTEFTLPAGITLPDGVTIPDNITIPGLDGLSGDCKELYSKFIAAFSGIGTGDLGDLSSVFDGLAEVLPDDLKDDAQVMSEAFAKYSEVLKKYNGDITKAMADPDAQAALQAIGTDEVTAASENITHYFDETCPQD